MIALTHWLWKILHESGVEKQLNNKRCERFPRNVIFSDILNINKPV